MNWPEVVEADQDCAVNGRPPAKDDGDHDELGHPTFRQDAETRDISMSRDRCLRGHDQVGSGPITPRPPAEVVPQKSSRYRGCPSP